MNEISKKRYSRQRESILSFLRGTTTHPTANQVYDSVRYEIPNISLGTVYRNLAGLVKDGEIIKIDAGGGAEHYDACVKPHGHMVCRMCAAVTDVFMDYDENLDRIAEEICGGKIDAHRVIFEGLCSECTKEK